MITLKSILSGELTTCSMVVSLIVLSNNKWNIDFTYIVFQIYNSPSMVFIASGLESQFLKFMQKANGQQHHDCNQTESQHSCTVDLAS